MGHKWAGGLGAISGPGVQGQRHREGGGGGQKKKKNDFKALRTLCVSSPGTYLSFQNCFKIQNFNTKTLFHLTFSLAYPKI